MELRIEKRLRASKKVSLTVQTTTVGLGLLISAFLIRIAGANPLATYQAIVIGSTTNLGEVLVKAIPLILCGLAVTTAAKAGFSNVGVEGQLCLGGIGAAGVALFVPTLWPSIPSWILIFLMVAGGTVSGTIWGLVPSLLKAFLRVNEILTTLMTNYIAIFLVQYLYYGPWRDPKGRGFPGSALFVPQAWFPCFRNTRIHLGLAFAMVLPAIVWFILNFTKLGYQIRIAGESQRTAKYAGINTAKITILAMLISGGIAGIAGASEVGGILHRLHQGLAVGNGYTGLIIAWMANLNPWGIVAVAFLLAGLLVGGDQVQITMGLPASVGSVIQGFLLLCLLGTKFFTKYSISWRGQNE